MLLAGALASAGTYWGATLELAGLLDDQLRYVAEHVEPNGGKLAVDTTNVYRQRLSDDSADEVLLEVWQGQHLDYTSNVALRLPPPTRVGLVDVQVEGQTWHTYVAQRGDKLIRVAQAKDGRWEALARVAVHLFWPVVALIPLFAAFLWFGIGRGLRPLGQIASQLATRNANSMAPVQTDPMPDEVKPLVDALNDMLLRLHRAFASQRAFVADAAHELRTPAMALSVQVEAARHAQTPEQREAALAQVQLGVSRFGHLARQLLTIARLEPGAHRAELAPVDLVALCKSVILEQVHAAEAKQIDLGLAEHDRAAVIAVMGEAGHLHTLLGNLVDNAIRYTLGGGRIDVAVRRESQHVALEVCDDGPGIPAEERPRVLDRFYRGKAQGQPGSGLGLSIVKRIAEEHGATVSIASGLHHRGTCVLVRFPSVEVRSAEVAVTPTPGHT
ncbi:MAG: ATP-binding protein [Burkholderiaceae bacterium]